MKALILAAALVASPGALVVEVDGGQFDLRVETLRSDLNDLGHIQVEMTVGLKIDGSTHQSRIGVLGCEDGHGIIAKVNRDGTKAAEPESWLKGGPAAHDALATAICQAADWGRLVVRKGLV